MKFPTLSRIALLFLVGLPASLPVISSAQTVYYDYDIYDQSNAITSGDWVFELPSTLSIYTGSGVTGGTQTFMEPTTLQAYAADSVTGGQQIFTGLEGGSEPAGGAWARATHALSGANITLYDNTIIETAAEDAFGAGATVRFNGSTGYGGTQTWYLRGYHTTIGSIDSSGGNGLITNAGGGAAQFIVNSGSYSGVITDGGGGALTLRKQGAGTLALSNASNAYSGGTFVEAGALVATAGGALGSGGVTIDAGATLEARGTFANTVAVSGTLTNGDPIGTLTTGAQTWNGGGTYRWGIASASGTAGTAYDQLAINGGLTVASSSGTAFTIALESAGHVSGFDSTANASWTLVTTTGITGYDAGDIALSTSGFSNNGFNGTFSIAPSGNNLVLTYTGAPDIDLPAYSTTSSTGNITSGAYRADTYFEVDTAGGVSGGDIHVRSGSQFYVTHENGITGGYQDFTDSSVYFGSGGSISGGEQEFYGDSYLNADTGAITGGTQVFHDSSYMDASAGAVTGATLRFDGNARFEPGAAGAVTNSFVTYGPGGSTQAAAAGAFVNTSILFDGGGFISLTNGENPFGTGTTLSFRNGGQLDLPLGNATVYGLQSLTVGAGLITGNLSPVFTVDIGGTTANTFSGVIADSISLVKAGTGTLTLSGANTYTGGTTLSGGTLGLGSSGAIGSAGTISFEGGTLQFSENNTSDYSGRFSTAAGQQYAFDTNGQSVTLAGNLTSAGGTLTKRGEGTLTLSGVNTYTGGTTLEAGAIRLGNSGNVLSDTGPVTINGGIFLLGAANETIGTLSGSGGTIETQFGVGFRLTVNQLSNGTFAGVIHGDSGGSLVKVGAGTLTLTGASTYTGTTAVNAGKLVVNGSLSASSAVAVNNGGTLGGSGSVAGPVTINSGGKISPGNSPGALNTGAETWAGGGGYVWELNDASDAGGAKGVTYDWLNSSGTLDITATSGNKFTIYVTSLAADNTPGVTPGFIDGTTYQWIIASGTSVTNFSADKFAIDTSAFLNNSENLGDFTITQSGGNILLNLTYAVPEPSTWALAGVALCTLLVPRLRGRQSGVSKNAGRSGRGG